MDFNINQLLVDSVVVDVDLVGMIIVSSMNYNREKLKYLRVEHRTGYKW
jgi:hypothetical protein